MQAWPSKSAAYASQQISNFYRASSGDSSTASAIIGGTWGGHSNGMQNHLSYECIIHEGCLICEALATNVPASGCNCSGFWLSALCCS